MQIRVVTIHYILRKHTVTCFDFSSSNDYPLLVAQQRTSVVHNAEFIMHYSSNYSAAKDHDHRRQDAVLVVY